MLIGFIGCPCSGKTTTGALLFAKLKEAGFVAEFLPEQARNYIAHLHYHNIQSGSSDTQIVLTDQDQINIMMQQFSLEKRFKVVCQSDSAIIADSSSVNALFYMSNEARKSATTQLLCETITKRKHYDVIFRCSPIYEKTISNDKNRIHSQDQSLAIDAQISQVLDDYFLDSFPVVLLEGSIKQRASQAIGVVLSRLLGGVRD